MTDRARAAAHRNQIPRLVWSLTAVGVCVAMLVMVMGFRSLSTVDEQYVKIRRTTAEAEAVAGRVNNAWDAASAEVDTHLDALGAVAEDDAARWERLEAAWNLGLGSLEAQRSEDGVPEELAQGVGALFAELRLLRASVVDNHAERWAVGQAMGRSWEDFLLDLTESKAAIDKAQGMARLQMQAGLRGGGAATEEDRARLLGLASTSDAVRALTVELSDLNLLAERLRGASDPELLHSLRENSLRQTLERLRWVAERLPESTRDDASDRIDSLAQGLLGDPAAADAEGLYALKTRELLARDEAERLRRRHTELREGFAESERFVEASIREMMGRDANRATTTYRRVWRDSFLVGTVLLGGFIAMSSRIARLGRRAEIALRKKNAELERMAGQLEDMATTDALTGLPNRRRFLDRLDQVMKRAERGPVRYAVLFFDFDRFKFVNDSLGHEVGDALLIDITRIFRNELRGTDTVARFGGDEFVVLLSDLADDSEAEACADRLLRRFAEPHHLGEHVVVSTASIGLVSGGPRYHNPFTMIRDADAAMYDAKESGKGRVAIYDDHMHAAAQKRLTIEQDLHRASDAGQLRLVYQPIIDLTTGHLDGFEALLRWDHPVLGPVPPVVFIPIAEDSGTIVQIGRWVIETACAQAAEWNRGCPTGERISVSVNVSKRQLVERTFCDKTIACLARHGNHPGDIKVEITESLIAYDPDAIVPRLKALRHAGIPIVMDDFGTGVSSLSALHECPIDNLKIDRSFILAMSGNRSLVAVVASITALAESLGISTVAEGIEDPDVVGVLLSVGCRWGQGFHFGKPMPAEDASRLIEEYRARRSAA